MAVIEAHGVRKSYGPVQALTGVDLVVQEGEFWTLFGPNGAGKTTFIAILATLLKPTAGQLMIDNVSAQDGDVAVRKKIGVVTHATFLYRDLTAFENLMLYARLYEIQTPRSRVQQMLDEVGLAQRANERVRGFSRGMMQRLAIARALLHSPALLLLDEPCSGLDHLGTIRFMALLESLVAEKRTVMMTTHDMDLGLRLSSHVGIMSAGRIVYEAPCCDLAKTDFEELYSQRTR